MKKLDPKKNNVKSKSEPRRKYLNHAELVQGVCQVDDQALLATDRLFLNCLAAHTVNEYPHPGNQRLVRACGIRSRQGLNKIEARLLAKKLIEIVEPGGGRNNATVYRICVEDERFPWPKQATPELPFSKAETRNSRVAPLAENKPATGNHEKGNSTPENPQLDPKKPATPELHPNLTSEYKPNKRTTRERPAANPAASPEPPLLFGRDEKRERAMYQLLDSLPKDVEHTVSRFMSNLFLRIDETGSTGDLRPAKKEFIRYFDALALLTYKQTCELYADAVRWARSRALETKWRDYDPRPIDPELFRAYAEEDPECEEFLIENHCAVMAYPTGSFQLAEGHYEWVWHSYDVVSETTVLTEEAARAS